MTKSERYEVAETIKLILKDPCDEIRNQYTKKFGSLKGLREYVRNEVVNFWTYNEPYLDKEYCDMEWFKIGDHIINLDDCWCNIRDGIKYITL